MFYSLITFFCFFFALPLFSDDTPILVHLSTEKQLLPLYLSPIQVQESGFSAEYLKKLEDVLKFDLNFNGMTTVVKPTKEMLQLDQATSFQQPEKLFKWQKFPVYYVVKCLVNKGTLSAKLLIVNQESVKAVDGIALTGLLAEDRRKMHLVSDLIFKALFNQSGIAQARLLYTAKQKDPKTGKSVSTVIEADYDGANAKAIIDDKALCVTPCYFPPKPGHLSRSFAYVSYQSGQPKIYFSSIENKQVTRFTLLKGNQFMPAFSPNRDRIAFVCDVTGNPDLFIQKLDPELGPVGKPIQLFTSRFGTQASPTFSPDGHQLAFVSNKDGSPRIYVLKIPKDENVKNPQATLLTKQNRENTAPNWSPDGKKIAYSALTKGVRQIWVYDLDSGKEEQLTDGPFHKENPCFAPNSLHIAFNSSQGDGLSDIYVINLNHKRAVKITSGKGEKRFPSWEPRAN
ncbi:MAG: Tol-Pal system protein TolB [Parachlamydiaceae bacterium]